MPIVRRDRDPSSSTRLSLGARGSIGGAGFSLAGRRRIRGPRDAAWNEWTLRFDDGRASFLSETIDELTLFSEGSLLPAFDLFVPGARVETGFVVVERGRASREAEWGDVESARPSYAFVELSGRDGSTASIEFGVDDAPHPHVAESARVFLGCRVTAAELGMSVRGPEASLGLLVAAPDVSRPKGVELWLRVGDGGSLGGTNVRIVGSISRSMVVSDERVRWDEYLLAPDDASAPFRWLVVCDGHFNLVEAIAPGLVRSGSGDPSSVTYQDSSYEGLSEGTARVEWVSGLLPSRVDIGDTAHVKDFVLAPHLLTEERHQDGENISVTWSRGVYVAPAEIAKAFGRALPRPVGHAPNAPPR